MDLVRTILLDVETIEPSEPPCRITVDGHEYSTVVAHIKLMINRGLIEGRAQESGQTAGPVDAIVFGLTWEGHDFLDQARSADVWNRAKAIVEKAGVGITLETLKAALHAVTGQLLRGAIGSE